jgi:hypothetical protein
VLVYGIFALSATAAGRGADRHKFDEAPLAYLLSAFGRGRLRLRDGRAGAVRSGRAARHGRGHVELIGVLVVGTISLAQPDDFPDATVWSGYGEGYGFVPLVLPVLGLLWLRHTRERA